MWSTSHDVPLRLNLEIVAQRKLLRGEGLRWWCTPPPHLTKARSSDWDLQPRTAGSAHSRASSVASAPRQAGEACKTPGRLHKREQTQNAIFDEFELPGCVRRRRAWDPPERGRHCLPARDDAAQPLPRRPGCHGWFVRRAARCRSIAPCPACTGNPHVGHALRGHAGRMQWEGVALIRACPRI